MPRLVTPVVFGIPVMSEPADPLPGFAIAIAVVCVLVGVLFIMADR